MSRVKKPTHAEAETLAKLFPSSSSTSKRSIPIFDPSAESVVVQRKRQKKAITRKHFTNVTVVMMTKYSPYLPKKDARKELICNGRAQSLPFSRNMSKAEVMNQIMRAFKVEHYTVLEPDSTAHYLLESGEQSINGEMVINRKGWLYLCEGKNLVSSYFVQSKNTLHY